MSIFMKVAHKSSWTAVGCLAGDCELILDDSRKKILEDYEKMTFLNTFSISSFDHRSKLIHDLLPGNQLPSSFSRICQPNDLSGLSTIRSLGFINQTLSEDCQPNNL
jgi:hypothetical protein